MCIRFIYSSKYEVDIGPHVFPTSKYRLVRDWLLAHGVVAEGDFVEPPPASREELLTAHTAAYLDDLEALRWTHRTQSSELPISREIVDAYRIACGGTILAAREALRAGPGVAVHIGGGFHHAFADRAEGFCYLNDIAVAIRVMMGERSISRAAVVDCDLHQGNGTAHIFEGEAEVLTVSLHQENNYPAKQKSDIDIGLDDRTGDDEYLARLEAVCRDSVRPHGGELLVYVAGADPYLDDQLGGLSLTMEGLRERDRIVLECARGAGMAAVVVFAGGYAHRLEDTVQIHANTCVVAKEAARNRP